MDEVFPVLAGIAIGLVAARVSSNILRALLIATLGIAFGFAASWLAGELAISWVYLLIDTAQVIGASVLTTGLVVMWRHRRAGRVTS
ncbi:MAG TPA: hypothetical protein VMS64_02815 [Candidatus Methylomirabilis sp.]|nr:hypothetical protein [Candidatus Methylomirabilis sp.]